MQDVDEERVVLQEVVRLQAAAVSNPKVSKKFVVVGWKEKKKRLKQKCICFGFFVGVLICSFYRMFKMKTAFIIFYFN